MGCILANIDTTVLGIGASAECIDGRPTLSFECNKYNSFDASAFSRTPSLNNRVVFTPRGYAVGTFSFSMSCELHNVIKPEYTYTRLTYIECNGKQYINTGYVVQEDDVIDMYYISTSTSSADKALFGAISDGNGLWTTIYSNTAYIRFGSTASVTISNARMRYKLSLRKGKMDIDDSTASPVFTTLPTIPLYIFASNNNNNNANMYGYCRSMGFKITKTSGEVVMDLKPCKRDSDGKVGMLDLVSGQFFTNSGAGDDFVSGNEIRVTDGYEIIDHVTFDNDKGFDTGYYGDEQTYIDVLFQRTDTSSADYLFGCSSGSRITAYLTASGTGYWRYGNAYKSFNVTTKKIYNAAVSPTSIYVDNNGGSISPTAFTTSFTLPLGGHKGSSGKITTNYQGYVYFFRMWHGDELLVDWYPCRRRSDSMEGFWDCVTQQFITPM